LDSRPARQSKSPHHLLPNSHVVFCYSFGIFMRNSHDADVGDVSLPGREDHCEHLMSCNPIRFSPLVSVLFSVLLVSGLAGCAAHVGPKSIPADRFDYSTALTRSWKEQMLLNMVKIRYMDPPLFLNVQQVVQQYTLAGSGSIIAPGWTGNATIAPAGSVAGTWAESPTITYSPLSGEQFTKSILQPVSPADLLSLVEAGWPIDSVFGIGVRSINGLHAGSRTELLKRSGDPDFYRVLALLKELQASDSFGIRVDQTKQGAGTILVFRTQRVDETEVAKGKTVRELLHLNPDAQEFRLSFAAQQIDDKEIAMLTRSMLEILAEASAGVEIPSSDVAEGRVLKMDLTGPSSELGPKLMIHVHSSSSKPASNQAFSTVPYRNYWFWVDDTDLASKRGLGFMMLLFTLVESGNTVAPPVLTISKP